MKTVYIAGCNMAGYMPDGELCEFETQDEAKRYIISLIKMSEELAETETDAETLSAFAEDVNLQSGEFSAICLGWCYFVTTDTKETDE